MFLAFKSWNFLFDFWFSLCCLSLCEFECCLQFKSVEFLMFGVKRLMSFDSAPLTGITGYRTFKMKLQQHNSWVTEHYKTFPWSSKPAEFHMFGIKRWMSIYSAPLTGITGFSTFKMKPQHHNHGLLNITRLFLNHQNQQHCICLNDNYF